MVGRQTSGKCATCRARKIRCDLGEPACVACKKASWVCPGYADRFVVSQTTSNDRQMKATLTAGQQLPAETQHHTLARTPISPADILRFELLVRMEGGVLAARLEMMPATHILKHIPRRIGLNPALDDAVNCITQAPLGHDSTRASVLYGVALRSLRRTLNDPRQCSAPETLAAASVLQMYEQHSNHPGQRWVHHARGVVKMLQAIGSTHASDAMERAILEAQAGNVFLFALAANRECFLAHPAWERVLRPSTASDRHLDIFMRMIVDGDRHLGVDHLCRSLVRQCEYDYSTPLPHQIKVGTSALMDMLRMRKQLQEQMEVGPGCPDNFSTSDPIRVAAYAATGFFLITTNTILLGLYEQLTRLAPENGIQWPAGISDELLKIERLAALDSVTDRFRHLAAIDPQVRFTAPVALRIILATVLGISGPSSSEAATLLMILDQGLEDAPWASQPLCDLRPAVTTRFTMCAKMDNLLPVEAA
ncbi:hypothetical protein LTR53_006366 [Teratosphaeriaceae sp. CCFEE 6253]|nr:hypothetical protein LTR53_006366 [Teratosphaeriaceae sp. CCFEE 6253]